MKTADNKKASSLNTQHILYNYVLFCIFSQYTTAGKSGISFITCIFCILNPESMTRVVYHIGMIFSKRNWGPKGLNDVLTFKQYQSGGVVNSRFGSLVQSSLSLIRISDEEEQSIMIYVCEDVWVKPINLHKS